MVSIGMTIITIAVPISSDNIVLRKAARIGDLSFELYLFHYPIAVVLRKTMSNSVILSIACFAITMCITLIWKSIIYYLHRKRQTRSRITES